MLVAYVLVAALAATPPTAPRTSPLISSVSTRPTIVARPRLALMSEPPDEKPAPSEPQPPPADAVLVAASPLPRDLALVRGTNTPRRS